MGWGEALLLLEVYADSLELWGSHQKLIVLEGVARLLPIPNLISRLCNEVRIRGTLKMGKGENKFHHQSNTEILKDFSQRPQGRIHLTRVT